MRRSLLYVPGSSEDKIRKAAVRGADVIILDLEDGVHPDLKTEARDRVARLTETLDFGGVEVWVRGNALETPWGDEDLAMLRGHRRLGAVFPKAEDPAEVARIDAKLGSAVTIFLMVETARGVLNAPALARSSPRVGGLIFGAADFRESVRAPSHPEEVEILFARSQVLLAARAAGVDAFDTPWFDYRDETGLRASAGRARALGFDGKTAIHPAQVAILNEVFSPSTTEIARARRIVEVMEQALREGKNVATLDGEMIEALHLRGARRVLERAGH